MFNDKVNCNFDLGNTQKSVIRTKEITSLGKNNIDLTKLVSNLSI